MFFIVMKKKKKNGIRHVVLSLVIDGRSSGVKASTTMQV